MDGSSKPHLPAPGMSALLYSSLNPHFMGFIVLGVLAGEASFALTRASRRRD
jgi:hypothetical protein